MNAFVWQSQDEHLLLSGKGSDDDLYCVCVLAWTICNDGSLFNWNRFSRNPFSRNLRILIESNTTPFSRCSIRFLVSRVMQMRANSSTSYVHVLHHTQSRKNKEVQQFGFPCFAGLPLTPAANLQPSSGVFMECPSVSQFVLWDESRNVSGCFSIQVVRLQPPRRMVTKSSELLYTCVREKILWFYYYLLLSVFV